MLRVARHFSASDTGLQRRANEDSFLAHAPVFAVADGMGGAQAGEVASRAAIEHFATGLSGAEQPATERLAQSAAEANARIHALSQEDSRRAGMGTTLTAAYVEAAQVAIAHVGDSRAYCLRGEELTRLTSDHSLVEELVRQGRLTEAEAEEHPQRSIITRALGPEPEVEIDTLVWDALPGDVYLLCSDGLTGMVPEEGLRNILLRSGGDLAAAGQAMIGAANAAGGRDNITVVLFSLEEAGAAEATPATAPLVEDEAPTRRLVPRMPDTGAAPADATPGPSGATAAVAVPTRPRRALPVWLRGAIAMLIVLALFGAGGWIASQTVYFVGTDGAGRIALYRGLPYELPAGLSLYSSQFVSGVTVAQVSAAERRRLLNHKLRSHDDASDLLRRLERGQINQG